MKLSIDIGEPETWLPVRGFEGVYEVSSLGRVRSLDREISGRSLTGVVLRTCQQVNGYLSVYLTNNGVGGRYSVHRIVLTAFAGERPVRMVCRHMNGSRQDNRVTNLAWGTSKQNSMDQRAHGTVNAGERNGRAKLSTAAVAAIRGSTEKLAKLAALHGVNKWTISKIRRGVTWAA